MSSTPFIEALSSDPYVRNLHRAAVRLLNDPTLDRGQRVKHIQRLQHRLLAHQAKVASAATAKLRKEVAARTSPGSARTVAEDSQVKARRQEFRQHHQEVLPPVAATLIVTLSVAAANDASVVRRNRPLLTLKRA